MLRPDNLIPLTSGAYSARGLIANAQRCINLYPEVNAEESDAPQTITHYPRPGLIAVGNLPVGRGRGVFTASNGALYAFVGANVYVVDKNWNATLLGQIDLGNNNPVSLSDNGTTAVIVDGTKNGYTITLATNELSALVDPTGIFAGGTRTDFADTFFAFNVPGTNEWLTSLSNQVSFNALNIAAKDSSPDPIQTLAFNLRQMWLIGSKTSEVWYLSGGSSTETFPYSEWPNIFIPYGCAAPYSLAQADVCLFWLSRNEQGQAIFVKTEGYAVEAISTRAIEYELSTYPTVADCVAYAYQQAGHTFIAFNFPTADKNWTYDLSTKQWHQREWIDNNGKPHRERVGFVAQAYGAVVGQDWATGQLYVLSLQAFTDNGQPIVCRRSFPHEVGDLKEVTHVSFVADFGAGSLSGSSDSTQMLSSWNTDFNTDFGPIVTNEGPMLNLRYSNDAGATWSNYRRKGLISAGHYRSMMRWRGLGMARDRVYELSWSAPMLTALQGAYLDPMRHGA